MIVAEVIWIINLVAKYNEGMLLWNDLIPRIAQEQKKLEWSSSSAEWKKKKKWKKNRLAG